MDVLISFLAAVEPYHWLVFGLVLLIAEMASGTTYLLWPAVAAFLTALVSWTGVTTWVVDMSVFAVLVIGLTWFGRPLVAQWRQEHAADGLNERASAMIGVRGVVASFANGVGAVRIADTQWRAVSDESLSAGDAVEVVAVDGVTLRLKRAN